jgi:hypothetical protein
MAREINCPQKSYMTIERSNHKILEATLWIFVSFHQINEIITFKYQSSIFGSFLTRKFFIPKFMKIECYLEIFTTF